MYGAVFFLMFGPIQLSADKQLFPFSFLDCRSIISSYLFTLPFMCVCIHLRANSQDLIEFINSWKKTNHTLVEMKIVEFVIHHNAIIDRIKLLAKVSSPIVLAQFFISSAELCTLAFDVIMVKNQFR